MTCYDCSICQPKYEDLTCFYKYYCRIARRNILPAFQFVFLSSYREYITYKLPHKRLLDEKIIISVTIS